MVALHDVGLALTFALYPYGRFGDKAPYLGRQAVV